MLHLITILFINIGWPAVNYNIELVRHISNITDNNVLNFGLTDLASLKSTTFSDMLYNGYNGWQYSHLMQMKDAGIVAVLWGGGSTIGAFQNVQQTSGNDNYWLNKKYLEVSSIKYKNKTPK